MRRLQQERNALKPKPKTFDPSTQRAENSTKVALTDTFDTTLYDRSDADKFAGYNTTVAGDDEDDADAPGGDGTHRLVGQYTATKEMMNEFATGDDDVDLMASHAKGSQIADRETDYQKRRFARKLSPTRKDGFANGNEEAAEGRSYKEVMQEREIEREEERVRRKIEEKMKNGDGMDGIQHEATLKLEDKERDAVSDGTRKRVRSFFPFRIKSESCC